jgi:hypothetical protein
MSFKQSGLNVLPYLVGAGICAGMGVGCDVNIHEGKASVGVFSAESTDQWTHHYPLTSGGVVEVVNVNGPVEITTGDAGGVDIHATITAKALTDAGARDLLSKGKIQEAAEPARVHVETVVPRAVHGSYTVSYELKVPPGARVDATTTNGNVSALGINGTLKATTLNGKVDLANISGGVDGVVANGSLTVRLNDVTAPVRLEVTNGRLSLQFPAAAKANLSARVVNGGLTVSGLAVSDPTGRRIRNLEAPLNGGGPEVTARVTNGRLTIEGK